MDSEPSPSLNIDFSNTEIAFSHKSNNELKEALRLFKLMNKSKLVNVLSNAGKLAIDMRLPFAEGIIKKTLFSQFVGGTNLMDCQEPIEKLYKYNTLTILDYGAEGKTSEEDLDSVLQELLRALDLAASNTSVPCGVTKLTALVDNDILEKLGDNQELTQVEQQKYNALKERLNTLCKRAHELNVSLFIDAEESWIQDSIDLLVEEMMEMYNKEKCVVYTTLQMYRKDRLAELKALDQRAQEKGYVLGVKLVRGAYMDKERVRALTLGYSSPINETKEDTDKMYNDALLFCLKHYDRISFCNASHNELSNRLLAESIIKNDIDRDHPHINFCQLYGMSDNITFNLAKQGFNVAKYVPYGPVKEVFPYLIRRAKENQSVAGEVGRELKLIQDEMNRRGI